MASSAAIAAPAQPTSNNHPGWAAADRTGSVRLKGQVPLAVAKAAAGRKSVARVLGAHAAASTVSLNFSLPLRNRAALDRLIKTEAKTHQYPSRAALYAEFSPSKAQFAALRHWLVGQGYTITHVSADRTSIAARARTSTVERSLSTKIDDYQRAAYTYEGVKVPAYRFYSNTTAARVPARLGIQSVSGLSDVDRFFTDSQLAAASSANVRGKSGSGPRKTLTRSGGGYYPRDLRSMYDVTGHGVNATGQTVGFTLWGAGETQAAMTTYATTTGEPPITVDPACQATGNSPSTPSQCVTDQPQADHLESILENGNDNGTHSGDDFEYAGNAETGLDIEQSHGMAPGVAMKYYLSDCTSTPTAGSGLDNATCNGTDVGMEEAVEDAANDPTLHTVSNSWGYGGDVEWGKNDPFRLATEASYAMAAAAGTTFWFGSGDSGVYEAGYPDDGYVVSVGGTSLFSTSNLTATDTSAAVRSTATTWAAGGSWCTNLEPRPFWQDIPAVVNTDGCPGRAIPDISAIADTNTSVYEAYTRSSNGVLSVRTGGVGGTSVASPVMSGLEADTEAFLATQNYGGGSTPAIGFEAPMMYQLGSSSHGSSYFYDVDCGNTADPSGGPNGDAAGVGWDPATGWGELDWYNYSVGYAIALGATGLTQPASLDNHYSYSCAQTPTNASERAVSLPTNSVGYSLGAASSSTPWPGLFLASRAWGASNNFLKTTDGGQTWQTTNSDMMSIACTSSATCVEVGDGGRIRRTTDGGTTWTYVNDEFTKALTSIACPSSTTCYAAGDRGTVLKSTDGGATWSFLSSADGSALYGLACPSTSICYAVDQYAHVMKTVDGGASWTLESTPVTTPGVNVSGSGGPEPFAGLFGITCTTINTCVAVGGFPPTGTDAPILTTTDGGLNWTLRTSNSGASDWLNGVTCVGSTCYAVGRAGTIVTSTDGGATWSKMTSNTTLQLTGITCRSAASCVATGQTGTIDVLSGGTWTVTSAQAGSNFLAAAVCTTDNSCVAAGKQGATLAFDPTNVAASATLQAGGGTTLQMNGLSCVDAKDCVAVGNTGTIITTSDGGQTWPTRTSGTTANLTGVSCAGSSCTAVGAVSAGSAVVLTSADGGVTWTPGTSGTTNALAAVTCTSATSCVAVGAAGTILATTDGSTWSAKTSNTTVALSGVTCVASRCYAVGAATGTAPNITPAVILVSTDGGSTWSAQASNSNQSLTSVACTNDMACFAAGAIGTVVTTVDGGATWTQQGDPISGPTTALNSGPTSITAVNAAACTSVRCVFGTASAGDIMTTPLLTVTVTADGSYGDSPPLSGLSPDDNAISYSPNSEAGNVTGTLTCTTTATASSDPGSYPITACSGLADSGYSVVYDLDDSSYTIGKADQTIDFPAISDMTYGDPAFTPNASASSGLPVEFSADGDCDVDNGQVEITGAGSCTVTASQDGNLDYKAAESVSRSFDIAKADQTITFSSPDPKTFGDPSFAIDPTASSGLPVSVSASGSCSLDSDTAPANVTITGAGSCSITASQDGNKDYNAADDVKRTFDVAKANQTITFDSLPDRTFNDAPFTLDATASSGLPVSYTAAGQCTVSDDKVTITGAGSCMITASQDGNDNYNPASDVSQSFDIAKDSQTITFPQPDDTTLDAGHVTVSGTASSGLTVLFSASGTCSIDGDSVHLLGVGDCTVTATQSGDSDYLAAPTVARTFHIGKGDQTIDFATPADHRFGTGPYQLSATATSGLPVSFAAEPGGACTVVGSAVVLTGAGSCTIDATQDGDDDWKAAPTVTRTFTVTKAKPVVQVAAEQSKPTTGQRVFDVSVIATASVSPTGSVVISVGSASCTVSTLSSAGTGRCPVLVRAGDRTVHAAYSGDADYAATKGSAPVTIGKRTPKLSVSTHSSSASGGKRKLTVSTQVGAVSGIPATGTITVSNASHTCSHKLSGDAATCSITVRAGSHTVTVSYSGDSNYAATSVKKKVNA